MSQVCSLMDLAREGHTVYRSDPLAVGLGILAGRRGRSPYRVAVVDRSMRLSGVLSGRRILEVLLGYRGLSLIKRLGIRGVLREPVHLFADEPRHVMHGMLPPETVIKYMAENNVGYVIVVGGTRTFKGVVDEISVLSRLKRKELGVRVEDVMKKRVWTARPGDTLLEAARKMVERRVRRLPVVYRSGRLRGIITITDVLSYILTTGKYAELLRCDTRVGAAELMENERVEDVMTTRVIHVRTGEALDYAISKLVDNDISGLPVVDEEGRLSGIISRIDVIAGLAKLKGLHILARLVCGEPRY